MEMKKNNLLQTLETLFLSLIVLLASFLTYFYFNTLIYDHNMIEYKTEQELKKTFIHLMFISCGVINGVLSSIGIYAFKIRRMVTRLLIGPILFYVILLIAEYHGTITTEVISIHTHYLPTSLLTFIGISSCNILFHNNS